MYPSLSCVNQCDRVLLFDHGGHCFLSHVVFSVSQVQAPSSERRISMVLSPSLKVSAGIDGSLPFRTRGFVCKKTNGKVWIGLRIFPNTAPGSLPQTLGFDKWEDLLFHWEACAFWLLLSSVSTKKAMVCSSVSIWWGYKHVGDAHVWQIERESKF